MKPQAAVLTGDLIGSTDASPAAIDLAIERIQAVATGLDDIATFARFRGDGWQLYLASPGLALATALLIFARLRAAGGLESRISIGLGGAYFSSFKNLPAVRDVSSANGEAFIASGRALDEMDKDRRIVLSGEGVDLLHRRLVSIIDDKVAKWSREQAVALTMALGPDKPQTQAAMAERLGISRQAVASRLQAADFSQLNAASVDFLHHFGTERDHE